MDWSALSDHVLAGVPVTPADAMAILDSGDDTLLPLLQAAFQIRSHYWGRGVRIHVLRNAKSGICAENCSFCSQASSAYSGIDHYKMQSVEELIEGARAAHAQNAVKYCIVTATRGPSTAQLDTICDAVRRIKAELPIKICTSLGLLAEGQAEQLAAAGVDRFNHNLETSEDYYPKVCQTHTYQDRMQTLQRVKDAGMETCCGGIMGMGEAKADRIQLAFSLAKLGTESVPVNFLDPRPGTPLEKVKRLSPSDALRCLAMFRFVNPSAEIRVAGGREVVLRDMQALALYPANSLFSEGYLTTGGQGHSQDEKLILDAGFFVESIENDTPNVAPTSSCCTESPA
ncbi:MAG: biotin synthase BioB [Kiritimatiellae bacterium]|nr:biotin synthase BioB [Kiritimatiellia bacterium]